MNSITHIVPAAAVIAALMLWAGIMYNRFVTFRNRCRNGWAQIDILLERRHELIPRLEDVVRRYAAHERDSLQRVTDARTRALAAGTVHEKGSAESDLADALSDLFAVSEAYPELKAYQTFLELQRELGTTEEKIRFARQFYNDTVMRYNTLLGIFPNVILARLFSLDEEDYFSLDGG
jgi:LemA protein